MSNLSTVQIFKEMCKGCRICVEFCPTRVLEQSRDTNERGFYFAEVKDGQRCTGCKLCELMCPDFAVVVLKERVSAR